MTSKGIVVFARNNAQIDYVKQARFLAIRAKGFLGLPTTIITDCADYLYSRYPDWHKTFEKVISISWNTQETDNNTVLSNDDHVVRTFYDGALAEKQLEWKNTLRAIAYDASPYDETLVLDTDVVICNQNFLTCFEQKSDFLIYKHSIELLDVNRGDEFRKISDSSVDFYWASAFFFRKSQENKIFFDLIKHIQENWMHYKRVFQINSSYFRNDYAFSIAIHIMNGYQSGNFAKPMPGNLYFVTDKSILWEIDGDSLLVLLEKPKYTGEYTPLRINKANTHVMNKFSLSRCIDEV